MAKKKQANGLNWTLQALDCYRKNYDCSQCIIKEIMITECHMKESIEKILREVGPPMLELLIFNRITKHQVEILKAIKKGYRTKEDLAKYFNVSINKIQGRLRSFYKVAQLNGCQFPDKKTKLSTLISFIEQRSKEIAEEYCIEGI